MKTFSTFGLAALAVPGLAQITIDLGTAADFALLAVKGVASTGPSIVRGSIGTTGHVIQGFPPAIQVSGSQETQNDVAAQAQADFLAARDQVRALTGESFGKDGLLDGDVFTPGVFNFAAMIQIVGDITLSGAGQFFFTAGSHLLVSNNVVVRLEDGALATNVYWAPGDATIIGNSSIVPGFILTDDRVQLNDSSFINGQLYAESDIAITNSFVGFL